MAEILIQYGLLGLFLSCFLAGTVVPFSSEVVMSFMLFKGLDWHACLLIATIGNTLGTMTTFYVGYMGKWDWVEKYWKISREKILGTQTKLKRFGSFLAAISFLPGIGNVFVLGLGFFRLSPLKSAFWMTVGNVARYLAVIMAMDLVM